MDRFMLLVCAGVLVVGGCYNTSDRERIDEFRAEVRDIEHAQGRIIAYYPVQQKLIEALEKEPALQSFRLSLVPSQREVRFGTRPVMQCKLVCSTGSSDERFGLAVAWAFREACDRVGLEIIKIEEPIEYAGQWALQAQLEVPAREALHPIAASREELHTYQPDHLIEPMEVSFAPWVMVRAKDPSQPAPPVSISREDYRRLLDALKADGPDSAKSVLPGYQWVPMVFDRADEEMNGWQPQLKERYKLDNDSGPSPAYGISLPEHAFFCLIPSKEDRPSTRKDATNRVRLLAAGKAVVFENPVVQIVVQGLSMPVPFAWDSDLPVKERKEAPPNPVLILGNGRALGKLATWGISEGSRQVLKDGLISGLPKEPGDSDNQHALLIIGVFGESTATTLARNLRAGAVLSED